MIVSKSSGPCHRQILKTSKTKCVRKMFSKKKILTIALMLVLVIPTPFLINGTKLQSNPRSLEEVLMSDSTDIITGKVISSESFWANPLTGQIYTILEIEIDSTAKKTSNWKKIVTVGHWGGEIDGIIQDFIANPYGEVFCKVGETVTVYARNLTPTRIQKMQKNVDLNAIRIERLEKVPDIVTRSTPTQQPIYENQWIGFEYDVRYWDTSDFPIHYRVNGNTSDCTGEYNQVTYAFNTWENDSLSEVDYTVDGTCSIGQFDNTDANAVFWQSNSWFANEGYSGAVGLCTVHRSDAGRILDFDIALNDDYTWSTDGTPSGSEFDVQTIVLHEAGHILWLGNLEYTYSSYVMTSPTSYGLVRRTLQLGDKEGVRHIYPDSSYPKPTVSIISPSDASQVTSPCGIYATVSVSGTTIDNVKYRVCERDDPEGYDSGWVSMTYVSGSWRGTWTFNDQNTYYYITVRAETAQGQMGYDWIEVYD